MAVRIWNNGRIVCAAMHDEEPGDTYIDDNLHYALVVDHKVLVTYSSDHAEQTGEWWWKGNAPIGVDVD